MLRRLLAKLRLRRGGDEDKHVDERTAREARRARDRVEADRSGSVEGQSTGSQSGVDLGGSGGAGF